MPKEFTVGTLSFCRIMPKVQVKNVESYQVGFITLPINLVACPAIGVRMKSGTLGKSGVFCYAGYFQKGKSVRSFVIFLNQKRNNRDKLLRLLYNYQYRYVVALPVSLTFFLIAANAYEACLIIILTIFSKRVLSTPTIPLTTHCFSYY